MNLLIGCRVVTKEGNNPNTVIEEGTVLGFQKDEKMNHPDIMVLRAKDNKIGLYRWYQCVFNKEDLQMLQQVGRTKEQRRKFLTDISNRFNMMDLE